MRKNRRNAKKPKILSEKIVLASLIKKNWTKQKRNHDFDPPHNYYWSGSFISPSGQLQVYIYFQRYVKKPGVDYVNIRWENEGLDNKALAPAEIRTLLKSFSEKDFR